MQFAQKLIQSKDHSVLLPELAIADHVFARMKGLLGISELGVGQGLWIHRCNSIHTFFMKFDIDCLFLNQRMEIVGWRTHVQRQRIVFPIWQASSVIETSAGVIEALVQAGRIGQGDKVHVCS